MNPIMWDILLCGLQLWLKHEDNVPLEEKQKLINKYYELKDEWYEEVKKPFGTRDDALIDNIELRLRTVAGKWTASVRSTFVGSQPGKPG